MSSIAEELTSAIEVDGFSLGRDSLSAAGVYLCVGGTLGAVFAEGGAVNSAEADGGKV